MHNEEAVAEYNELIAILKEMPVPTVKQNLMKQSNVRWLRRHIKPEWHRKSERALKLLEKCDETSGSCGGSSPVWQEIVRKSHEVEEAFKAKYLKEKGLEVTVNGWPGTPPKVYSVKLDFTDSEWVDLMNTEGEFLPMCCATISEIRDTLISCLRDGGFIKATELFEICQALKDHHDCSDEGSDPQNRLLQVWEKIKDEANLHLTGHPSDPNDIDDAFSLLYHSSATLAWNHLTGGEDSSEKEFNHDVVRLHEFSRVLPAIRTIYKTLTEKGFEPIEGYGVAEGTELLAISNGFAVYKNEERAQEMADEFNKYEERSKKQDKKRKLEDKVREKTYGKDEDKVERTPVYHKYSVRKVRISLEKGVEFLEGA